MSIYQVELINENGLAYVVAIEADEYGTACDRAEAKADTDPDQSFYAPWTAGFVRIV